MIKVDSFENKIEKKREKGPIFWTPSTVKSIFFQNGPSKLVLFFCVVISASRCFFWAIKNKGGQKLCTWLLGLRAKTQNRLFNRIDHKWKNTTRYGWFGHLLPICLYLLHSIYSYFPILEYKVHLINEQTGEGSIIC